MIALLEPGKASRAGKMTDEEKWRAVMAKDPKADGKFYFSVKTTGVYCRPSCSARTALRKNITLMRSNSVTEAVYDAGFHSRTTRFVRCCLTW